MLRSPNWSKPIEKQIRSPKITMAVRPAKKSRAKAFREERLRGFRSGGKAMKPQKRYVILSVNLKVSNSEI